MTTAPLPIRSRDNASLVQVRRALRDYVQHNASVKTDGFGLWKVAPDEVADTDRRPPRRR